MKRKWPWYVLAGVWVLAAVLNALDNRSALVVVFDLFAALVFLVGGFALSYCERKEENGQELWNKIQKILLIAIVAITVVIVILSAF